MGLYQVISKYQEGSSSLPFLKIRVILDDMDKGYLAVLGQQSALLYNVKQLPIVFFKRQKSSFFSVLENDCCQNKNDIFKINISIVVWGIYKSMISDYPQ